MAKYTTAFSQVTLDTTHPTRTLETTASGAGSAYRVTEVFLSGQHTSSVATTVGFTRTTALGSGGTQITAANLQRQWPLSADPAVKVFDQTAFSTPPTIPAQDMLVLGFNALGGLMKWTAPPDHEVYVFAISGAAKSTVLRSRAGTNPASGHIIFEEL